MPMQTPKIQTFHGDDALGQRTLDHFRNYSACNLLTYLFMDFSIIHCFDVSEVDKQKIYISCFVLSFQCFYVSVFFSLVLSFSPGVLILLKFLVFLMNSFKTKYCSKCLVYETFISSQLSKLYIDVVS